MYFITLILQFSNAFMAEEDALEPCGVVYVFSSIADAAESTIEEYGDHIAENRSSAAGKNTDDDVKEEIRKESLRGFIGTGNSLLR